MPKKLLTIATVCAALVITAGAQQSNQSARTWALIVGISKYQKLPGGQQLQFADRDATLLSEAIQKRGVSPQNVRLLIGADATAAAIKSAVGNWLARAVSEQDTVLIFFSGHGLFEREFGESYLLGYDSDPKDPYGTALSISELGQALARRVRSGRVLIVADAVRRDFFDPESDPNSSKSFEQSFDQLTATRPGVFAILGSGPGEFSREGQRWSGHGVFARHLADVLFDGADQNGDLAVTADNLFALLKGRVSDDTSGKQHPWRSGSVAQTEVARVERQGVQTPVPGAELVPKLTTPAAVSPKPPDQKSASSDPRSQPERNDPAITRPAPSGRPTVVDKPVDPAAGVSRPVGKQNSTEDKTRPAPTPVNANASRTEPAAADPRARTPEPKPTPSVEKKIEPGVVAGKDKKSEPSSVVAHTGAVSDPASGDRARREAAAAAVEKPPVTNTSARPDAASSNPSPKPAATRTAVPPMTGTVKAPPPIAAPPRELARADVSVGEITAPPNPKIIPPSGVVVSSDRATNQPETASASVPTPRAEAAPSPLVLQLEAAIASRSLIEPRNTSAWDLYQRMLSEPGAAADAARLKPMLAEALVVHGRAIISGDVRSDNIADKVDDFKRAGQMLARARALTPDSAEVSALEKLSAAEALISLQFYDEAERALAPLQTTKLAAVENALGLVYQGKLDAWRAERAFKRACEIDSKWSAPHYNLASLYRSQQNQAALGEFEAAAANDQNNVSLLTALGDEYFARQQWRQAADAFRKAIALKPADDNLHTKLGHALYSQGSQDEANREYQRAQELRRRQP